MQSKWQVNDLLDLEYFLSRNDSEPSHRAFAAENLSLPRSVYLAYEKSHLPPFDRGDLIKHWLDEKRKNTGVPLTQNPVLPGDGYLETLRLLRNLIIAAALIFGTTLAWSVLSYSGKAPINIFSCIWIMIVPQFILLLILGISMTMTHVGLPLPFKGRYPLFSSVLFHLFQRALRWHQSALTGKQRSRLSSMAGDIHRQKKLYGSVFFWPAFILAQIFGLCFNIGMLGATLIKLFITDLAFGWQSTLHPNPETVYHLIKAFSLPWSWFASIHPSIEEIQGSQMILKDGMIHLSTPDLVSWWPFLCFSLLFYGLMPRLALLLIGIQRQNHALKHIHFSSSACDRLIQQMRTPQIKSSGEKERPSAPSKMSQAPNLRDARTSPNQLNSPPSPEDAMPAVTASDTAVILVPEDIEDQCNDDALQTHIANILGLSMLFRLPVELDAERDMNTLNANLLRPDIDLKALRIILLMEAWQPPIRETLAWLARLRATVGKNVGLIIVLIGKPVGQMIFTPPDNIHQNIWEQAIKGMGDPFIRIEVAGSC